jgi:serine/threonine protein kinase
MRRETEVQRRLDHPHVMPIVRAADDASWFSMPYATASLGSLQVALRVDPGRPRAALVDVVAGLAYAHGRGLIHRDLSPANVLRLPNGAWVVADWGLVHGPACGAPPLTAVGEGLGTARFTAPEVLKDATTATPAADAYSIGALAEWLVFGTRPRRRTDCVPAARRWWDLVRNTVCSELDDRWAGRARRATGACEPAAGGHNGRRTLPMLSGRGRVRRRRTLPELRRAVAILRVTAGAGTLRPGSLGPRSRHPLAGSLIPAARRPRPLRSVRRRRPRRRGRWSRP